MLTDELLDRAQKNSTPVNPSCFSIALPPGRHTEPLPREANNRSLSETHHNQARSSLTIRASALQ
jgi:hypothetical protein